MRMTISREKSAKRVVVGYLNDTEWEVWMLRFHRGSKKNKPVKSFADVEWKTKGAGCPYAATRWDFADERAAEAWFAADIAEHGGSIRPSSLLKTLAEIGYTPYNWSLGTDTQLQDAASRQAPRAGQLRR